MLLKHFILKRYYYLPFIRNFVEMQAAVNIITNGIKLLCLQLTTISDLKSALITFMHRL